MKMKSTKISENFRIGTAIPIKIFLVLCDVFAVNAASYFTIWLRFGLQTYAIPPYVIQNLIDMALINTAGTIIIFYFFHLYNSLWRYASIKEIGYVLQACVASSILNIGLYYIMDKNIFRSYYITFPAILIFLVVAIRFSYRTLRIFYRSSIKSRNRINTMIIGGGDACSLVMKELDNSISSENNICCIIDDDISKKGQYIHGVKIVGGRDKILEYVKKLSIREIVVAIPSASRVTISDIVNLCQQADNCKLRILPSVYQLVSGDVTVSRIRNVNIEDLLGREVIDITTEKIGRHVSGKVVLVTGAGGSIGSELCRQIAANGVEQLIMLDIYENGMYAVQQELTYSYPNLNIVALVASVRNNRKMETIFEQYRPNIVYHAAAHKHVPLMETSPNEAVKNNVFGTYKVALNSSKFGVEKFILISTDKAVNPTNIMGATKRICEMIIQMFNEKSETEFSAVRFGNVLGSNGSVIPIFKDQIAAGGPLTVTHPDVIRYFMTIPEAVALVLEAGTKAKGGEIFVLDMGEPVKILDLAKNLIRLSGFSEEDIEIKFTGLRPGEKLYEELLMDEEGLQRTDNELIFVGNPIEYDREKFIKKLDYLYYVVGLETDDTKSIVSNIIKEYKPKGVDVIKIKGDNSFLLNENMNVERFVSETFIGKALKKGKSIE